MCVAFSAAFPSTSISFAIDIVNCNIRSIYHPKKEDIVRYTQYWSDENMKGSVAWNLNVCTFGNSEYTLSPASDHPVFPEIVTVPCSGKTPYSNMDYDVDTSLGLKEYYAFQEFSAKAYEKYNGKVLTAVRRIVSNIPETTYAYGQGSVGCDGEYCFTWIEDRRSFFWLPGGTQTPVMSTLLHELGHTLTLEHSGSLSLIPGQSPWAYGDSSCIMGSADSTLTCFNAPNARQLGYITPVADMDDLDMPLNTWISKVIPIFSTSPQNPITLRSKGLFPTTIFLSARSKDAAANGADSGLSPTYDKVLSIHMTKKQSIDDREDSTIIAILKPGSIYLLKPGVSMVTYYIESIMYPFDKMEASIAIKLISLSNAGGAVVSICRFPNGKQADSSCKETFSEAPRHFVHKKKMIAQSGSFGMLHHYSL